MTILVYPLSMRANKYAELQAQILVRVSGDVLPITLKTILKRLGHRSETAAIISFFEDRTAYFRDKPVRTFVEQVATLLLLKIACSKIVWIRHNHWPHGLPRPYPIQNVVLAVLNLVATTTVTHREVGEIDSVEVPHPLYRSTPPVDGERDIEFMYFGSIMRYKGLDTLLEVWPANRRLLIAGPVPEAGLLDDLSAIVARRELSVEVLAEYLSDEALDALLSRTKYVVQAHKDDSMIVSGAFFHAASLGANVLARKSSFSSAMAAQFDFVTVFEDESLSATLASLQYVQPSAVFTTIETRNGNERCVQVWKEVLEV